MTDHLFERSLVQLRERVERASRWVSRQFRTSYRGLLRNRQVLIFWLQVGMLTLKIVKVVIRMFHAA